MINIIKYIQCLLLAACIVQNVALGVNRRSFANRERRQEQPPSCPANAPMPLVSAPAYVHSNQLGNNPTSGSANRLVWVPIPMIAIPVQAIPVGDDGYIMYPYPPALSLAQPLQTMPPSYETSYLNPNAKPFVPGGGSSGDTVTPRTNEAESGGAAKSTGPKRQPKQPWADSDSDDGQSPWDGFQGGAGASSAATSSGMHNRTVGKPGIGDPKLSFQMICTGLLTPEVEQVQAKKDFFDTESYGKDGVVVTPSKKQIEWARNGHLQFLRFFKCMMYAMPQGKIRECMEYSRLRINYRASILETVYIFYIVISDDCALNSRVIFANCQTNKPIICQTDKSQLIITIPAECADVGICQPIIRKNIEELSNIIDRNIDYVKLYKFCSTIIKNKEKRKNEEKRENEKKHDKSKLWIMLRDIFYELSPKQQSA